jgi:type II secretory pathway pseudopilin PulG
MLSHESGRRTVERSARSSRLALVSTFRCPRSTFPAGLTLIELLVTIVIMVSVLAGVIPLMSPNNNARKIREAARELNSLVQQAQAIAARTGRPAGISFREYDASRPVPGPYSGMALEAFLISSPAPFSGYSQNSRVLVDLPAGGVELYYGELPPLPPHPRGAVPNKGKLFRANYNGYPIRELTFVQHNAADYFPPRMLRIGDTVEVGGNVFLICDDEDSDKTVDTMPNLLETLPDGSKYLVSDPTVAAAPVPGQVLHGIWLNGEYNPDPLVMNYRRVMHPPQPSGEMYVIRRQPAYMSEAPLQFPRGIGIDLAASGAVGSQAPPGGDLDTGGVATLIDVMFASNGSLDALYIDNSRLERIDRIYMLLGLFENGNNGSQEYMDYNFLPSDNPVPIDKDVLAQRRSRINWLNADSRWVTVDRSGRTIVSPNNVSFNPAQPPYIDGLTGTTDRERAREQLRRQIDGMGSTAPGARLYAQQMQAEGGR